MARHLLVENWGESSTLLLLCVNWFVQIMKLKYKNFIIRVSWFYYLERLDLLLLPVPGDGLRVNDASFDILGVAFLEPAVKLLSLKGCFHIIYRSNVFKLNFNSYGGTKFWCHIHCDQMGRLFYNLWPFTEMNIFPLALFFAKLKTLPKFKTLPNTKKLSNDYQSGVI